MPPSGLSPRFTRSYDDSCQEIPHTVVPVAAVKPLSSLRVALVDDEAANCRLGLRLLAKLGIPNDNVHVLVDGASAACCWLC